MDIFVVTYHLVYPPHPKFVLLPSRRISIYVHLVSGITEIVSGVMAFVLPDVYWQNTFTRAMSIASITHVITAFYQTGLVFGAKGIMVPGYIYAITLHAWSAFHLYHNIDSLMYIFFTYLMLHIYVWCRFFIFFFRVCNMFEGYHYTVAITLSGLLLFPFTIGPIGNFGMLFIVIVYGTVKALLSRKSAGALSDILFREHERYALITSEQVLEWKSSLQPTDVDRKVAKEVFDRFDFSKAGFMDAKDIFTLLKLLDLPYVTVGKVLEVADTNGDGKISFNEFYRFIWNLGTIRPRLEQIAKEKIAEEVLELTPKARAKLVFDMIDIDGNKYVGLAELDMLLSQWGMPHNEAHAYLDTYLGGKSKVNFEAFYTQLRPLWEFAASQIFNA